MIQFSQYPHDSNAQEPYLLGTRPKRKREITFSTPRKSSKREPEKINPTDAHINQIVETLLANRGKKSFLLTKISKEMPLVQLLKKIENKQLDSPLVNLLLCRRTNEIWLWKFQKTLYAKTPTELLRINEHTQMLKNAGDHRDFKLAQRIYNSTLQSNTANEFLFNTFIVIADKMDRLDLATNAFKIAQQRNMDNSIVHQTFTSVKERLESLQGNAQPSQEDVQPSEDDHFPDTPKNVNEVINSPLLKAGELPVAHPRLVLSLERSLQIAKEANELNLVKRLFHIAKQLDVLNAAMCKTIMKMLLDQKDFEYAKEIFYESIKQNILTFQIARFYFEIAQEAGQQQEVDLAVFFISQHLLREAGDDEKADETVLLRAQNN